MTKKISLRPDLKVPPAEVFRAFSNATVLREWLCDVATVNPREGGRLQMGTLASATGPGKVNIGQPLRDTDKDWVALVECSGQ